MLGYVVTAGVSCWLYKKFGGFRWWADQILDRIEHMTDITSGKADREKTNTPPPPPPKEPSEG